MALITIRGFSAPVFQENAWLMWRAGTGVAVAVDPGGQAATLVRQLDTERLRLDAILLTHAHIDHIEGIAELTRRYPAPVYLHPADQTLYDHAADQAAVFGLRIETPPPVDRELADGQQLHLADIDLEVRHVPGHAPGHVILHVAEAGAAFVGDVIFQGNVGRTDLPGGNFPLLARSIRKQVFTLPADTVLHPGHGPDTTVGHEQATNPFLIPQYGGGLA